MIDLHERLAEFIGDDLNATQRAKGKVPFRLKLLTLMPILRAFVGSHITGYDNMLRRSSNHLLLVKKANRTGKVM